MGHSKNRQEWLGSIWGRSKKEQYFKNCLATYGTIQKNISIARMVWQHMGPFKNLISKKRWGFLKNKQEEWYITHMSICFTK